MLSHIIYMSRCVKPLSEKELVELLALARASNTIHNITGVLVYSEGNIFQIIEGERKDLDQLYLNISNDKRHSDLGKFADKEIPKRCFDGWTMAYKHANALDYASLVGFCEIDNVDFSPEKVGAIDSMLLNTLKKLFVK